LQASRNLTADQAEMRIAAQRPVEEKIRRATAVITNNGSLDDLAARVLDAWSRTVQPNLR
jgi:dephospho-CoA kinase